MSDRILKKTEILANVAIVVVALLLVLSRDCRYCTESAPFYQRLTRETAGRPGLHLIAVFPQEVAEGRKYLEDLGVYVNEVRQASPSSTGGEGRRPSSWSPAAWS